MTGEVPDRYRETLLIESVAETLQIEPLCHWLFDREVYGPYVLVGLAVVLEYVIFDAYNYFITGKSSFAFAGDPFSLMIGVGMIIAVIGVRYMIDGYADAIGRLRIEERDIKDTHRNMFERTFPRNSKLVFYFIGFILYYLNLVFILGLSTEFAIEGIAVGVGQEFILFPLVYLPLIIDFLITFLAIHFLLPRRIDKADLRLFFYDPRNMGGFGPVGELFKRSYYAYTAGLLAYFLLIYGAVLLSTVIESPYPEPGASVAIFFTIAWLIGFSSIAHSMYRVHTIMKSEKDQRIRRLEERIHAAIDNPFDIENAEVIDQETLEDCQRRLEQVRNTKEYPTTFTMWSQIIISVLLPQALNMAVQAAG